MKNKFLIIVLVIIIVLTTLGIITNYIDSGRVTTGNEPKCCIKIVSQDGSNVTYWGLGYKVVRYVGVSPNEPYKNSIAVKMGNWFMKYDLPLNKSITVDLLIDNKKIEITNFKDVGKIESLLLYSKYDSEICNGINTHKITIGDEVYYLKESCKEIQKGNKQAKITQEDLDTILNIFEDEINEKNDTTSQIHNSFVGTVLEETTTYMIVEPNEDETERKSADKIIINYGTDHKDYLYGVGRKVIINYTGYIKETYPAQIDTDNILTDGYKDFALSVKTSDSKKKTKIINNRKLYKNNSDFDLYYYGLDEVNVTVNMQTMSLLDALKSGKITIDGIIAKANQDFPNAISYDDGGTMEYHYENYTIIKFHTLDGNRDVYIGIPEMRLNNI